MTMLILLSIALLNVLVVLYVVWRFGAPPLVGPFFPKMTGERGTFHYTKRPDDKTGVPATGEIGILPDGRRVLVFDQPCAYPRKWEELES